MPSINLLPWREAERLKRQRDFGMALGAAVVSAIAVVMLSMLVYSQMISAQNFRDVSICRKSATKCSCSFYQFPIKKMQKTKFIPVR